MITMHQTPKRLAVIILITGFFIGNLFSANVAAQTRSALVQNVDEKGRIPFMQEVDQFCQSTYSFCGAYLNVPAGQRLVVTHVNAVLYTTYTTSSAGIYGILLSYSPLPSAYSTSKAPVKMLLPTVRLGTNAFDGSIFVLDQELTSFVDAGSNMVLNLQTTDGSALNATNMTLSVSGYLVSLN